jgi:PPP family 3-phenylpropionic acid transporter
MHISCRIDGSLTELPSRTPASRPLGISLVLFSCMLFGGIGIYMPFFPVWLESRGLTLTQIGLVLAIPMAVRVVAIPLITPLADGRMGAAALIAGLNLVLAGLYLTLDLTGGLIAIMLLVALLAVAQAPLLALAEVLLTSVVSARQTRLHYGRIRAFGSLAFVAATLAGGTVLATITARGVPFVLASFSFVTFLLATRIALKLHVPARHRPAAAPAAPGRWPPALTLALGGAALLQASHAMLYAFGTLMWQAQGYSGSVIGALWSIGVVGEIILFARAGGIVGDARRSGVWAALMIGGGVLGAVRFAGMGLEPGLGAMFALQALHAATFAAVHLGTMVIISLMAPEGRRARAQGLAAGSTALAMACITLVSGPLTKAYGGQAYLAMAPVALAGVVLVWLAWLAARRAASAAS